MAFVSLTRLHVRSILYFLPFMVYALRSSHQAQRSAGFLGGRLMRDLDNAFWTLTVWSEGGAMDAFRSQGAHRAAMPKLLRWCDEASLAHWTQDSETMPTWDEAYERMVKQGRTSKVNHPSAAQLERRIPPPRPTRMASELHPR